MGNIDLSFRMHFQVVSWVVHKYSLFFFQKIKKSENKKRKKIKKQPIYVGMIYGKHRSNN